jgi:hypothetical protein
MEICSILQIFNEGKLNSHRGGRALSCWQREYGHVSLWDTSEVDRLVAQRDHDTDLHLATQNTRERIICGCH